MNNNRNFIVELKHELLRGKMTHRLIIINVIVFIFIQLWMALTRLKGYEDETIYTIFALDTRPDLLIQHPWGIITSIFSHFGFLHLIFNMLFLYFSGKIYESIFSGKQLLITYLLGGIFGGVAEIVVKQLFFQDMVPPMVVGASGSIMAIFAAVAFHSPKTKLLLFGRFPVQLYFIALFFLIQDIIGIGSGDEIAHFAHLGGTVFGVLYVALNSPSNTSFFTTKFKSVKEKKVQSRYKSDEEFNTEKRNKQEKTDLILDKIAKGGYESLSKSEKDFLFNQSKNGK